MTDFQDLKVKLTAVIGNVALSDDVRSVLTEFRKLVEDLLSASDKLSKAHSDAQSDKIVADVGAAQTDDVVDSTRELSKTKDAVTKAGFWKSLRQKYVIDWENDSDETKANKTTKQLQLVRKATDTIANTGVKAIQMSFSILQQIYDRLKAASPLLQTIETLFNLAMTLFFMPLGNKLAEVLLPATLELVDKVVDMWDAFEGMSLGEMFAYAIDYGVQLFGEYFTDIGEALSSQGGLLGSIGNLLTWLGDFIEEKGESLLTTIIELSVFILAHLPELIALIVAFKVATTALMVAQMYVTATSNSIAGWFGLGLGVATAGTIAAMSAGAIAGGAAYGALKYADGGYVPATEGGRLVRVAEGGEGEYIVPESKAGSLGGGTVNNYFYGLTDDEIVRKINDTVNEQISRARLKGSFRWPCSNPTCRRPG